MKIQPCTSVNFNARNQEIRFADDIVRNVNKKFPRVSNTLMEGLKHSDSYKVPISRIQYKVKRVRELAFKDADILNDNEKVRKIISPIKDLRAGNCGESSYLSAASSRASGLKDVKFACLSSPKGFDYDHSVVLLSHNKKPYVLDAWLGFADYVPNAIKRWQNEFRHHFDFEKAETDEIIIKLESTPVKHFLETVDENILRQECPELLLLHLKIKDK